MDTPYDILKTFVKEINQNDELSAFYRWRIVDWKHEWLITSIDSTDAKLTFLKLFPAKRPIYEYAYLQLALNDMPFMIPLIPNETGFGLRKFEANELRLVLSITDPTSGKILYITTLAFFIDQMKKTFPAIKEYIE